ncbi:anti sigma factor C-terminal domain-containing protein [Clostridium thermarum]|uniref:anti sigma factor C-terminal domain-containing protein n=1 Tax=Clostridium thermarum TaxID=1716543 RepID=UPI0013CF44CB|nr:anti sigma factor C-terminal domain-containing protein [Clostridium thermarum]
MNIQSAHADNTVIDSGNKEMLDYIKELNPLSYVSVYVMLQEDIRVKDLDELRENYDDKLTFKWAAVLTVPKGTRGEYLTGFNPNPYDGTAALDSVDKDKYPYLQLAHYKRDKIDEGTFDGSFEEGYTKHFMSLLKYVNDRQKAVQPWITVKLNRSTIGRHLTMLKVTE